MSITCTRRLQFCMGHRVWRHESKCANYHGHNYVIYLTAEMIPELVNAADVVALQKDSEAYRNYLDELGRVIDFSVLKAKFNSWIEEHWDHGFIYYEKDLDAHNTFLAEQNITQKRWRAPFNPTAEEIAHWVLHELGPQLLADTRVKLTRVKLYETENCYAEVSL